MRRRAEPGPRFLDNALAVQDTPRAQPQLVNSRAMPTIGRLPLAFGPVEITLMEQIAQTLFEARLRSAADEGVQIGRAQVTVARQRAEYFKVAGRQLDAFAGAGAAHEGAALFHTRVYHSRAHRATRVPAAPCSAMCSDIRKCAG